MPFEDELGDALRRTGEAFRPAGGSALVDGGLARGRRRLARRRVSAVAGSALTVAVVASTALYLGGSFGGDTADRAADPVPPAGSGHFKVTADEMKNILQNGMERAGIGVVRPKLQGNGSSDPAKAATSSIVFEDGWGGAAVALSVRRVEPGDPKLKKLITCPPQKGSPYEECTTQPGNRAVKGYTDAGKAGGIKKWAVTMVSSNGYLIELATNNVKGENGESPGGRNPRMAPGKLRHLALFVEGSFTTAGEPNPFGDVKPGSRAEPGDMLPILKSLLPKRLKVYSEGATGADGRVVVVDENTGDRTYIEAVRTAGGEAVWTETRPDGLKLAAVEKAGAHPGVLHRQVDTFRPNGLTIQVSAYNAPTPNSLKSGKKPLITMAELKAIATDPVWLTAQ
ncbi:hypothetical protein [Streptomyces sp. NBC_01750]|uniref:hypothetical protein n=1 Tax=Streptomyces sp. NBC_01750 TaxID=2975928 RepID=UPI002DDA229A|nr:hypothetical protein [Streptomyces sp. NBC_01750]WSD34467.1 hypothetical protein OG966_22830 [Streptomyces sp. NBC_01750]